MSDTKIEWATRTWSPTLGCTKISEACDHCYAVRQVWRMAHNPNPKVRATHEGLVANMVRWDGTDLGQPHLDWTGEVRSLPERLDQPIAWRRPQRVFVCPMSDLFHPSVTDTFLNRVFATIVNAPQHRFIVLTKRPERLLRYAKSVENSWTWRHLDHVWFGVTAENQGWADERIPVLLQVPAKHKWVSVEPILGSVDLLPWLRPQTQWVDTIADAYPEITPALEWVVVGCESGPGARVDQPRWYEYMIEQCGRAEVPLFIKQSRPLNSGVINRYGEPMLPLVKMPVIQGRVWSDYPDDLMLPSDWANAPSLEDIV